MTMFVLIVTAMMSGFLAECCHGDRRTWIRLTWLWGRERTEQKEAIFSCFVLFCLSLPSLYGAMLASFSVFCPHTKGPFHFSRKGPGQLQKEFFASNGSLALPLLLALPSFFLIQLIIHSNSSQWLPTTAILIPRSNST